MPGTKRTSKIVSYQEADDDDDDFLPTPGSTKKTRPALPKDSAKTPVKSPAHKPKEIPSKVEQPDRKSSDGRKSVEVKKFEATAEVPEELLKKASQETITGVDRMEDESPKPKRLKQNDENTPAESTSEEEEEEEIITHNETPIVPLTDLYASRCTTTAQAHDSPPRVVDPKRRHSTPLGFPTSKINIPSLPTSRVGLSRKSSSIKPLHPTLNARPELP